VDIERDELETGAVRMRISDPGAVINGFSEAVKSYKRHINIGQIITDQYHAAHLLICSRQFSQHRTLQSTSERRDIGQLLFARY
jgi:hypothetical protein